MKGKENFLVKIKKSWKMKKYFKRKKKEKRKDSSELRAFKFGSKRKTFIKDEEGFNFILMKRPRLEIFIWFSIWRQKKKTCVFLFLFNSLPLPILLINFARYMSVFPLSSPLQPQFRWVDKAYIFFLTDDVGRSMEYIVTQGWTEEDKGSYWIIYFMWCVVDRAS